MSKRTPKAAVPRATHEDSNTRLMPGASNLCVEVGLANKFVKLGNITGTPIGQIVKRVGPPTSISSTGSGQLYQWMKIGGIFQRTYHYAISVDADGKAIGFTHQFVK